MRNYWLRILLGALAVYAVGMVLVTMGRHGRHKVESVIASAEPLTFPLPFVPFQLNGVRLGTMEHVVVHRDAPKKVSSIDLEVKLDDPLVAQGLRGCRLAANVENDSTRRGDLNLRAGRMGEHTFFYCASSDSGLVEFGEVTLTPGEVTLPLLVPESLVDELRGGRFAADWGDSSDALTARAESLAAKWGDSSDALTARAESLAARAEKLSDSIGAVQGRMADSLKLESRRLGDSLRAEGRRRADSVRAATRSLADSAAAR